MMKPPNGSLHSEIQNNKTWTKREKHNILVLCHGNKYRSPLCGAVLARYPYLSVRTAGFRESGLRAAKSIREAAKTFGYDLENHRSTQINEDMVQWSDHIVYMDNGNLRNFNNLFETSAQLHCLGSYARPQMSRIPDPAFIAQDDPKFEKLVRTIVQASCNFANSLRWPTENAGRAFKKAWKAKT